MVFKSFANSAGLVNSLEESDNKWLYAYCQYFSIKKFLCDASELAFLAIASTMDLSRSCLLAVSIGSFYCICIEQ
ncbi:unnamed protein product [Blepharisma stoltei]|uniref:Uncharacterized protein n=1 Tax=Blepharisma stoltei TaxID=1481888 RepID=A0AAU9JEK0_9CILI|nr:unnamed protein product [Blepharisma stoltei]